MIYSFTNFANLRRVDGDEQRPPAGQHFAFLIQDLAHIHVLSSAARSPRAIPPAAAC